MAVRKNAKKDVRGRLSKTDIIRSNWGKDKAAMLEALRRHYPSANMHDVHANWTRVKKEMLHKAQSDSLAKARAAKRAKAVGEPERTLSPKEAGPAIVSAGPAAKEIFAVAPAKAVPAEKRDIVFRMREFKQDIDGNLEEIRKEKERLQKQLAELEELEGMLQRARQAESVKAGKSGGEDKSS